MIGRMKTSRVPFISLPLATFFLTLASAQTGQAPAPPDGLPDAPGKADLVRMCTGCHGADVIVDPPRTVPAWADTLFEMKDLGAEGSEEDWRTVSKYLIAHLAHLEVNKATAKEIEGVFGVTETIAEGVVAYRDKQGGFGTIDDLKKAPDLDAKKVDSLKARLIF